jgi:hypothetical protein
VALVACDPFEKRLFEIVSVGHAFILLCHVSCQLFNPRRVFEKVQFRRGATAIKLGDLAGVGLQSVHRAADQKLEYQGRIFITTDQPMENISLDITFIRVFVFFGTHQTGTQVFFSIDACVSDNYLECALEIIFFIQGIFLALDN